jgi:Curli production assembly/transport component CsgG
VSKDVSRPLSDCVRREVIQSGKYEVIDRSNMDKILKEQSFQMTGCTQKDCAVEAGQLLGVGKIIVGTVSMVGRTYYLSLSLINVESGKTEMVEEEKCRCEIDDLIDLSKRVAGKLMKGAVGQSSRPTVTGTQEASQTVSAFEYKPTLPYPTKSKFWAGFWGLFPGFGNYYVGSFGERPWTARTPYRGILYTGIWLGAEAVDHMKTQQNLLSAAIALSFADALMSADAYNEYQAEKFRFGVEVDPGTSTAYCMITHRF